MNRLHNKRIVITAAAAGIGLASAKACAREAGEVWALDIDQVALKRLKEEFPHISTHFLDVLDADAVRQFADEIGPVDVLFNCAGTVANGSIAQCDEASWDFSFDLNVKAMYRLIRALLPAMLEQKRGNIINMASVAGVSTAVENRFAYSASKAAVVGMTKSIACDFVKQGIRCNAICPGTVDTPSLAQRLDEFNDPIKARKDFEERQPMGRLGRTEEIAALLVYLASDESAYTTGQAHIIDGGWSNS